MYSKALVEEVGRQFNSGLADSMISVMSIDPSTPATLYAGTYNGVFKSADAGKSWTAVSSGLANRDIHSLVIDPSSPAQLYAGSNGGGVFKSTKGRSELDSQQLWSERLTCFRADDRPLKSQHNLCRNSSRGSLQKHQWRNELDPAAPRALWENCYVPDNSSFHSRHNLCRSVRWNLQEH